MYAPLTSLILPKRQNSFFSSRRSILSSETISDDAVKTGYILFETLILILVVRKNNDCGVTSVTHCLSTDKVFKLKLELETDQTSLFWLVSGSDIITKMFLVCNFDIELGVDCDLQV